MTKENDRFSPHSRGGFFSLFEPKNMLEKLRYDYKKLQERQGEPHPYHTFNFFVTAQSLVDWSKHSDEVGASPRNIYIDIGQHLANSGKHFKLENKRDVIIKWIRRECYVEPDYCENDPDKDSFMEDAFFLELEDGEINVRVVASEVLKHWEKHISMESKNDN